MKNFIQLMKIFDKRMLDKYQKFSHWFQKIFGLTNFSWARGCLMSLGFFDIGVLGINVVLEDFSISSVALLILAGAIFFRCWCLCIKNEKKCLNKTKTLFVNELEKTFISWRLVSVWFTVFRSMVFITAIAMDLSVKSIIIYTLLTFHNTVIVSFTYFVSCTPLPPGKSKIKMKLKKLKKKVVGWLSPQPDTMPA